MKNKEVLVVNKLGLHARAAAKLVKLASTYDSAIQVVRDKQSVNAKSIIGIMISAASKGTRVELVVDGADEEEALNSLVALFEDGFGEGV